MNIKPHTTLRNRIVALCLATLGSVAHAAPVSWSFGGIAGTLSPGNSAQFIADGETLIARAYSASGPNGSGAFQTQRISYFATALGVVSAGETAGGITTPEREVGRGELIAFEFGSPHYKPLSFTIRLPVGPSDVQLWIGGGNLEAGFDFRTTCFSGCGQSLTDMGFSKLSFADAPVKQEILIGGSLRGRYLILAPELVDIGGTSEPFLKAGQLSGEEVLPPIGQQLPEPGTLGLIGIAAFGLGWVRRRQRNA